MLIPQNIERIVPPWFRTRLSHIDPALIVYFNPLRQRWIIDRCTRDDNTLHSHDAACPKTNVKVVQDDGGAYMPLCDQVLEWLQAHDTGSKFANVDAYLAKLKADHDAELAKLAAERRENTHHATLDGKRQIQQAKNLIDQHGLDNCEAERIERYERAERRKSAAH